MFHKNQRLSQYSQRPHGLTADAEQLVGPTNGVFGPEPLDPRLIAPNCHIFAI
jgi:hypothetical protein